MAMNRNKKRMIERYISCLFLILNVFLQSTGAWLPSTSQHRRVVSHSSTRLHMVESISLGSLGNDHVTVGEELAGSVQRWLDAEWMPQDVHLKMGESCKQTYIKCREQGHDDLMTVMMQVADDLTENWGEYDKDAFVGAYDISNYVSDFLTAKTGVEGCDCSARIY